MIAALAQQRRRERAQKRQKKLTRLRAKHGVASLSNERRRRMRLEKFGNSHVQIQVLP